MAVLDKDLSYRLREAVQNADIQTRLDLMIMLDREGRAGHAYTTFAELPSDIQQLVGYLEGMEAL